MNSSGFSTPLIIGIVLAIIAIPVIAYSYSDISRHEQEGAIENQINNLHISASLQSEQCIPGDGVDSGAQCTFTYSGNGTDIETTLKNAGYTSQSGDQTDSTFAVFIGGNPALTVDLNVYNSKTTLEVTRGN